MDQLAYKATKAMVGYKVNSITKNVKDELGFSDDKKKKEESEHDKQQRSKPSIIRITMRMYCNYMA